MHYDSIWKTTLIIIVIEMLLWAAYKGLKWYRKKKAEKKAYRGRAAWDTWLAHSHGQGTPAINPALMGPQAPFTSSSPSAPPLPFTNMSPNFNPHPLTQLAQRLDLCEKGQYGVSPQASQGLGGTGQERHDFEEELRAIITQHKANKKQDE